MNRLLKSRFIRGAVAFFRKTGAFFKKAGKAISAFFRRKPRFRLQKNFWIWLLLFLFSIVFTQALISPVSYVLFVFLLLFPLIAGFHLILGIFNIKLYLDSSDTEVTKNAPVDFSLSLSNETALPFPFLEAEITVPSEDAVRCEQILTRLSLVPFGSYSIRRTLSFSYRGSYSIGVSDVYCSDLFRMFRFRISVNIFRDIFVVPKRLPLPKESGNRETDENTVRTSTLHGSDNTEMSDIRDYRPGDSLRSVHWKLSGKTEELQVRQYTRNDKQQMMLFCDTCRRYDPEKDSCDSDINEYVTDGVIEAAVSIVSDNIRNARSTTLFWFDRRVEGGIAYCTVSSEYEFQQIFRMFASCPIEEELRDLNELSRLVEDLSGAEPVFVTGILDTEMSACVQHAATALSLSHSSASASVYFYDPYEKLLPAVRSGHASAVDAVRYELGKEGIIVRDAHLAAATDPLKEGERVG